MKTLMIKLFALLFTLLLISVVFVARADGDNSSELSDRDNFGIYLEAEDFILKFEDQQPVQVPEIKIYDSGNRLVVSGTEDDEDVRTYLRISDYLTEVNGTEYYLLSY